MGILQVSKVQDFGNFELSPMEHAHLRSDKYCCHYVCFAGFLFIFMQRSISNVE